MATYFIEHKKEHCTGLWRRSFGQPDAVCDGCGQRYDWTDKWIRRQVVDENFAALTLRTLTAEGRLLLLQERGE